MDAGIWAAVDAYCHEILERNKGVKDWHSLDQKRAGCISRASVGEADSGYEQVPVPIGDSISTLYRDDLSLRKEQPVLRMTSVPFDVSDKIIVLVDDVLFTGAHDPARQMDG